MKIVVAPNALKGSLSAGAAADAIMAGVREAAPDAELVYLPVADGGDGFTAVLRRALQAESLQCPVTGPLGAETLATFLYSPERRLAFIEMASAAGLALLDPDGLDPMTANTTGVGELILAALDAGARCIALGIGGSATHDGGMGMAQALGVVFLDRRGEPLPAGGGYLADVERIDISGLDPRLQRAQITVICDVDNPLLGEPGAARVFGPQKGASPRQVEALEAGMAHFADRLQAQLGLDVRAIPGAGAAGGLGAGALVFLRARLQPGAEMVLDLLEFDASLEQADLVVTAEGRLDEQTAFGKAPAAVARRARARGIPCIAIVGSLGEGADRLRDIGMQGCYTLCRATVTEADAMKNAAKHLKQVAMQMMNDFLAGHSAGVFTDNQDESDSPMIKKCLFPAAGYGTRFLPATKAMPKEVLPILDKPLIQYGVEEAVDAGMKNIAIITGRGKRAIEDHFDISYELEQQISGTAKENQLADIRRIIEDCTFSYTRQIEMCGLGHAILTGETLIGQEAFGVILADDLCVGKDDGVMAQMLKIYEKYRCSVVAIEEVDPAEVHKYGVIDGRPLEDGIYVVNAMVEKPDQADAPSNLAVIGRYILTPDIFDILRRTPPGKNGELQITDALQTQAKENMVLAYRFQGQRFDCGSVDGFVDATNYFYKQRCGGKPCRE